MTTRVASLALALAVLCAPGLFRTAGGCLRASRARLRGLGGGREDPLRHARRRGPLVVMIHGFPDFWYTWRHQMAALPSRSRSSPSTSAATT